MKRFHIENLTVSEWTTDPGIYSLQIRTEDRTKWITINHDTSYKMDEWTIEEAIKHYVSSEGKEERFDGYYRAYCD